MKKILFSFGFMALSLYASQLDQDQFDLGKQIYEETCISCHGVDGKAKTQMQLVVKPRDLTKTLLDQNQTYLTTKFGAHYWGAKADIMPSFDSVYNEEQLRAVTYYIVHHFHPDREKRINTLLKESQPIPKNKDKKMAKWGKKIYKRNCGWCHGSKGQGDGVATKNPINSIYPYDLTKTLLTKDQIFLYAKYGGHYFGAFKTDMPSWKKKYNDFKLHSVIKYIDEVLRKKNKD